MLHEDTRVSIIVEKLCQNLIRYFLLAENFVQGDTTFSGFVSFTTQESE